MNTDDSLRFIRKLQKKLRQIERLEQSPREPSQEEEIKISNKDEIRTKLQEVLAVLKTANISLDSTDGADTSIDEPVCDGMAVDKPADDIFKTQSAVRDTNDADNNKNESCITRSISPTAQVSEPKRLKFNNEDETTVPKQPCIEITKSDSETGNDEDDVKASAEVISQVAGRDSKKDVRKKTKKKNTTLSKLRKTWKENKFEVKVLEGHNYTITSLHSLGSWAVSGSKDTSVKLWNLNTGKEIRSMGGHTGWVSCVKILSTLDSDYIRKYIECNNPEYNTDISVKRSDDECFILSGSTDCSIRYWLVPAGICVKSLYNYSPVSSFAYHEKARFLFVCSDAGKLIVYDAVTAQSLFEKNIHDDCVKSIDIKFDKLITSSFDGTFKIWEIEQSTSDFENIDGRLERQAICSIKMLSAFDNESCDCRPVYSHALYEKFLYYGTEGANLRVCNTLDLRCRKLRNHTSSFGFTDAVCTVDDLLLSSSYDITTGQGTVNIRTLNKECFESYLATLREEGLNRIFVITATKIDENVCILTGGEQLILFKQNPSGDYDLPEVHTVLRKEPVDSDLQSESDGSEIQHSWFWQKSETNNKVVDNEGSSSESDSDDDHKAVTSGSDESAVSWRCTIL